MSISIRIVTGAPAVGRVCDCAHCVEPLNIKRQPVKDVQIRSVSYDRRRGRLEIEFTWTDDVRQFYPVPPAMYRQLLAAKLDFGKILHPKPGAVRVSGLLFQTAIEAVHVSQSKQRQNVFKQKNGETQRIYSCLNSESNWPE